MKRRDFLKTPGYFVAVATLSKFSSTGCGGGDGGVLFPQGVASGDPREDSVVLWTRVEREDGSVDPVSVTAQVSDSEDFAQLVLEETLEVTADSDHTLRLVVQNLSPGTRYFYRFVAGGSTSPTGRTSTAPGKDDDSPVYLAWVSCQDYAAGFFGAYRELIKEDEGRAQGENIQFVVHLGDFIYETVEDDFQTALDDEFKPIELTDRRVAALPSGGGSASGKTFANTLDDYRHLYKTFLSDPDLQAARARWPFIVTWDDHEFTDDCWQTQANYTTPDDDNPGSLNEASQKRKVAANQAWFEFIPAQLTGSVGVDGVDQQATDFTPVVVDDAVYTEVDENNQVTEENNVKAVGSMTIYRSFRFGKHVELVVTDERSYRSDHPIPEEMTQGSLFFNPRGAVPLSMVNTLDAGKTANDGSPPSNVLGLPNPRTESPPGTMLGPEQKTWWKDTMKGSDATWKIWGNQVPLMRFGLQNEQTIAPLIDHRVMASDAWDGYNAERKELMQHLRDEGIGNVVVITGDIHAHFAGLVQDDYDAVVGDQQTVAVEFCAAGIASNSVFSFFEAATRDLPDAPTLRQLITFDSTGAGGSDKFVENLNALLLYGTPAAFEGSKTSQVADVLANKNDTFNVHLRYADTNAQGFGVLEVGATEVEAKLVTVNRPTTDAGETGPGVKRTATFKVPKDDPAGLSATPTFTGTKPWPFE